MVTAVYGGYREGVAIREQEINVEHAVTTRYVTTADLACFPGHSRRNLALNDTLLPLSETGIKRVSVEGFSVEGFSIEGVSVEGVSIEAVSVENFSAAGLV